MRIKSQLSDILQPHVKWGHSKLPRCVSAERKQDFIATFGTNESPVRSLAATSNDAGIQWV